MHRLTLRSLCVWAAATAALTLAARPAGAQAAQADAARAGPLADPSADELFDLLAAPPPRATRAFARTAPPSTDGLCPADAPDAAATRNLAVVPYGGPQAPGADLAVQFALNSDTLAPEGRKLLAKLAGVLQSPQLQAARFAVAGHTDATGPEHVNLELSCARALSAKRFLVANGVAADRLSAYGFGSRRLLEPDVQASARNRRVEVRRAD
jgi:outer membrane protein OmpA-like peptidoglycan-associated protein